MFTLKIMRMCSFFLMLALLGTQTARSAPPGYQLSKRVDVGGRTGWDYLSYDPVNKHVFISRLSHVLVLDGESGATVADITGTAGVHGVAVAPELNRGFTSNGETKTVTIFDLKTLRPIGEAPTGGHPDAVIYDPFTKRVFTMNALGDSATAIDAVTGMPAGNVPLPARPEFAVADGKGMVFVNIESKHTLMGIDSQRLSVQSDWDMPGCEEPSGLSMDRANRRLFVGCGNKVMAIMDADSGKEVALVPIGAGVDATTFDPKTGLAFSPNGEDGTLTVIHEDSPDHFTVAETVQTEPGARTMALDEDSGTVYLVTASGQARVIASALLGIFRFAVRPALGVLGAVCLLIAFLFLRRRSGSESRKPVRWGWTFAVVGVLFLVSFATYDSVVLALGPTDFHMTIWKPASS